MERREIRKKIGKEVKGTEETKRCDRAGSGEERGHSTGPEKRLNYWECFPHPGKS